MPNETYTIEVISPLLRPGITIRTEVSRNHIVETVTNLMEVVRIINNEERPITMNDRIRNYNIVNSIDHVTLPSRPEPETDDRLNRCSTEVGCSMNNMNIDRMR